MAFDFAGQRVETREDAIRVAEMIVEGRISRLHNLAVTFSGGDETRIVALAASAQSDAADVAMLVSLSSVLPSAAVT